MLDCQDLYRRPQSL